MLMRLDWSSFLSLNRLGVGRPLKAADVQRYGPSDRYCRRPLAQLPRPRLDLHKIELRLQGRWSAQCYFCGTGDLARQHPTDIAAVAGIRRTAKATRDRHRLHAIP